MQTDKTYLINLDYRIDRFKMAKKQFEREGINYTIFPAIDARKMGIRGMNIENQGMIGCFLSHFFILQEALINGYKRIAIFEDDVILENDFKLKFETAFSQVPEKWELLYLGYYERLGQDGFKIRISENVVIPKDTWGTHGFMVQNEGIKKMWEKLKVIKTHIDVQISQEIVPDLYTYCLYPALCRQSGIKSDIQ